MFTKEGKKLNIQNVIFFTVKQYLDEKQRTLDRRVTEQSQKTIPIAKPIEVCLMIIKSLLYFYDLQRSQTLELIS